MSIVMDYTGYPCYILPSVITIPNLPIRGRERVLLTKEGVAMALPLHSPRLYLTFTLLKGREIYLRRQW